MFLSRACEMPLPLLPQLPSVKGEEPTPVCATPSPHLWEMLHKGPGVVSEPGRATLALSQHQCQADTAWLPHGWTGNMAEVPQGCCRRSSACPTQQGLLCPAGTEECRIHTEFPLSIPRNGCSQLPCPASALSVQHSQKTPPE